MRKQKGLTIIEIVIAAGLVVLITGAGFYVYTILNENNAQSTPEEQAGASITEEVDSPDEETAPKDNKRETAPAPIYKEIHKDDKYGFEIRYPGALKLGGEKPDEKLLFSLSNPGEGVNYEFWVQHLDGQTLDQVFKEKLELEEESYFEWIEGWGGEIKPEKLGENSWIFVDGTSREYLSSHFMLHMPMRDAYLIVDLGHPSDNNLELIRNILSTLQFVG